MPDSSLARFSILQQIKVKDHEGSTYETDVVMQSGFVLCVGRSTVGVLNSKKYNVITLLSMKFCICVQTCNAVVSFTVGFVDYSIAQFNWEAVHFCSKNECV